jgi:hypothetical protein
MTKGTACMYNDLKLERRAWQHFGNTRNLQLHIPIRNRRTLTSLVRWSRGWVFARRSLCSSKRSLQTKGYRSQRLSYSIVS